jgi:hypothetical protein
MNWNLLKGRTQPALRHVGVAIAIVLATTSFSTSSFAGISSEQRSACTGDVMRLCFTSIASGDQAIIACMTKNKDRISPKCKSTLPPI